ncbi:MAG: heme biosynthesis protein HemY [Hyphomicrobiales bacterium]|nr:heme biosynthesis protein HemY [Hyphomicrobiales bacterium]
MIRALFYILLVAGLALLFSWFAENPGQLTIDWPGYQVDISLFRFAVAILIFAGIAYFIITLLTRIFGSPRRLRRFMNRRRETKGYAALRRGIFAVGAGDETTAARYAVEARRALRDEPLTMLLDAQAAQLSGDHRAAQRLFEAMSENPETRLLGLRGLFLEASREKQMVAAEQYAARAMQLNPSLQWPVNALFDMQCRNRNWQGALETLAIARTHRHISRQLHDRRKAVLLTAQAYDIEDGEAGKALDLAQEAHRLEPNLVPAAVIAGRIYSSQGNTGKAARVLAKTWQYNAHPDLAIGYAYARPGDSPRDRLDSIKSLIVLNQDEAEARIALASAAVDAQDWEEAREALKPLHENLPTARVCALMARIEGGQHRDAGRVREWLARAVRAPRDPVWMADGVIFSDWQPTSPISGTLDAFEWRVPPDRSERGDGKDMVDEFAALSRDMENAALPNVGERDEADEIVEEEPLTITIAPNQEEKAAAAVSDEKDGSKAVVVVTDIETIQPASETEAKAAEPDANFEDVADVEDGESVAAAQTESPEEAVEEATAATGQPQPPRKEPKIFVPGRAPDDPGPGSIDYDDDSTPYTRYRDSLKTQTS